MGQDSPVSDPGQGRLLWKYIPANRSGNENPGSSNGTAFSLAKRIHGTADWIDPKGMLGSRDRAQRSLVAENPALVFSLLRTNENTSGARERRAGAETGSASGIRQSYRTAGGRRASPSIRTPRGLKPFPALADGIA